MSMIVINFLHRVKLSSGSVLTLYQSKLKAFADEKLKKMTQKLKFVLGSIENIVGKGENAVYQHFLLCPQCFSKTFVKSQDCVVKSKKKETSRSFIP